MIKSIIFISSALQQPRHQKRIDLLNTEFNVKVYYFYRNKYTENYKGYERNAKKIGEVKDGKYFSRILLLIKLYFILLFSKSDAIYCTSPDQALISIFTGKKVFLEVADLYQIDGSNRLYKILDYIIFPFISGLIITSPYYYSGYLNKFDKFLKKKTIVVENKLLPTFYEDIEKYRGDFSIKNNVKIRLGLIGNLSFKKSLEKIKEFIAVQNNYELHIFGDGLYNIFNNLDNVIYHGRFKSPEDLPSIYSIIDVNLILYDNDNNNVKLALPNKLYESIAFLRPIVCSDNVALSDIVRKDFLGEVVVSDDIDFAVNKIINNYDQYISHMRNLDSSRYICFEQSEIFKLINSVE